MSRPDAPQQPPHTLLAQGHAPLSFSDRVHQFGSEQPFQKLKGSPSRFRPLGANVIDQFPQQCIERLTKRLRRNIQLALGRSFLDFSLQFPQTAINALPPAIAD